ncbi:MAG: helix-turn-helix domain-containing protein [Alphaproteobacteria bacterium]|nr:helix-turn-helix domain-containing protein [Alphaproteobacteria bacterium]
MTKPKSDRPPYRSIDDLPELATPEEVAEVFRCSSRYIKNECTAGRMGAAKVAGKYLITRQDARAYLDRAIVKAESPPAQCSKAAPPPQVSPEAMAAARRERLQEALADIRARKNARRHRKPDVD